jgi:tetratricopeptide (TPR) repeat protein
MEKLAAGNAEEALPELEQALGRVHGRDPIIQNAVGEALRDSGSADRAPGHWLAAISLHPVFYKPYLNLGRAWEEKGQPVLAGQYYRAALALHPEPVPEELPQKVDELASAVAAKREEALEKNLARFRANPGDPAALNDLILIELISMEVEEGALPEAGIRAAVTAVGEAVGDLTGLRTRQESAVEDRPGSVIDRAGLGSLLLLAGEVEEAEAVYAEAVELSTTDLTSRLGTALADLLSGAKDDTGIRAAASQLANSPLVWLVLAADRIRHGETEQARAALFNTLQRNPSLPEAYRLLALTLTGEEEGDTRESSLRAWRRLLR